MIIGNALEIGVQLEYILKLSSPSGIFNFIVDDALIPGKGVVTDLYVVISSLKDSLNSESSNSLDDVGGVELHDLDFKSGAPENVIWLDAGELSDYGCVFWLGFDGNCERFFYSTDFEKTIKEKRFPKGTIEKLINNLPDADNLRIGKVNDWVTVTNVDI